jgi:hypothetical protein
MANGIGAEAARVRRMGAMTVSCLRSLPGRPATLIAIVLLAGCQSGRSTLSLEVSSDPPDLPIATLDVTVVQGTRAIVERTFTWDRGTPKLGLFLPDDVSGPVEVAGRGLSSAGATIATGQAAPSVSPGQVSATVAMVLRAVAPGDGGANDDAAADGPGDGADDTRAGEPPRLDAGAETASHDVAVADEAPDAGATPDEPIDAGGEDERGEERPEAGPDSCPAACGGPPAPPRPLRPTNGEDTGSVFASLALRPRFRWEPVAGAERYELEVDDSCTTTAFAVCTFPSPELRAVDIGAATYQPTQPLPVATVQPVGRRYFWRVRACHAAACSAWSPVRYVNVGRQSRDYNGDGYADVLMSGGPSGNEAVTLFLGGPALENGNTYPLPRGLIVSSGRDLNADGYADILIGDQGGAGVGIIFGGQLLQERRFDVVLKGEPDKLQAFGNRIAGVGDVDGDGFADLLVGQTAIQSDDLTTAFLYRGGAPMHQSWFDKFEATVGDDSGPSVAAGGDVNGDGYADIVVGSYDTMRVYFGEPGLSSHRSLQLAQGYESAAGDVNGDGYDDMVVRQGGATVFYGGATPDATPDVVLPNLNLGAVGDLNGDGFADVVLNGDQKVWLFFGGISPHQVADVVLASPAVGSAFGVMTSVVGDVDADGFADLVVSETYGSPAYDTKHRAYGFYGGPSFHKDPDRTFEDTTANNGVFGGLAALARPARPRGPTAQLRRTFWPRSLWLTGRVR